MIPNQSREDNQQSSQKSSQKLSQEASPEASQEANQEASQVVVATITKHNKAPKTAIYHKCNCNWGDGKCKKVWENIQGFLEPDHVWRTNGYQFQPRKGKSPTIKSRAFQASVFHHFNFTEAQKTTHKSSFRIAHHHFQEEFLKTNKITNLLTREKALALNKKIDTSSYTDQVNCVSSLLCQNSLEKNEDIDQYNNLYVGGP